MTGTPSLKAFPLNILGLILILSVSFLSSGCRKDSSAKELFRVEYLYNFEMAGGLIPQLSHMYQFNNQPVDINGVLDKSTMNKVRSASIITAELNNLEYDGGLKDIRKLECFIYPAGVDNEYYDIAYTIDLPRTSRDQIQLFSSGDEIKDLYDHQRMNVDLRVWLWEVTQRSRKMQFRILVGFYE